METEEIDYSPLPPRRGPTETRPIANDSRRSQRLNGWLVLVLTNVLTLLVTGALVWLGTRPEPTPAAQGMPLFATTILAEIPDPATRDQILSLDATAAQGRTLVGQNPNDANAWVFLGNAHYDFIQTIYEAAPDGEAYAQNISRWLEASNAYSESLALDPFQPLVRSDRALALIRYGLVFGPNYVDEGLAEADRALREDDQTLQVLLNIGRAYAIAPTPRLDQARRLWNRIGEIAPNSPQAAQAQRLLNAEQRP